MILRRVIQHVKKQEWTAIWIDLVIVVVGVFIGIQVNNWNEARKVREGEHDYLVRLSNEFSEDLSSFREKADYVAQVSAAGRSSLAYIESGKSCESDCWKVLVDFFIASQWRDLSENRVTLDAIRASPYPYDESLKRRLIEHYSFIAQLTILIERPAYRVLVRSLIPIEAQSRLWTNCHSGGGEHQKIIIDCAEGVSNETARAIVDSLAKNEQIRTTLTYYASSIAAVTNALNAQIAEGEKTLALVKAASGEKP